MLTGLVPAGGMAAMVRVLLCVEREKVRSVDEV